MATVPVTGLSALGNVLGNFGNQIGQQRRQDELTARARQLQLEDRAAALNESDRQFERQRLNTLLDRESQRSREDTVYERQRGDSLSDRDDQRLFAESAAIRERARALADRAPFEQNLQTAVDEAAKQLNDVRAKIDQVAQRVQSQPPTITASTPGVRQLAQQMAGGSRKNEEIDAMIPKALEQLQLQAAYNHQIAVKAAQDVLQSLKTSETQLTNLIQTGIQQRVAPRVAPTGPTPTEAEGLRSLPGAAPQRQASAADIANAVNMALGGGQPAGAPSAGGTSRDAQLFANPTNNPAIAAGNAELAARGPAMLQAQINDVTRQITALDSDLQTAGTPSRPSLGMGLGGYSVTSSPDPVAGAQAATSMLQQRAELENRRRALEAQLRGPTVGAATPPAISTPTTSTPAVQFGAPAGGGRWWETVAPTN